MCIRPSVSNGSDCVPVRGKKYEYELLPNCMYEELNIRSFYSDDDQAVSTPEYKFVGK